MHRLPYVRFGAANQASFHPRLQSNSSLLQGVLVALVVPVLHIPAALFLHTQILLAILATQGVHVLQAVRFLPVVRYLPVVRLLLVAQFLLVVPLGVLSRADLQTLLDSSSQLRSVQGIRLLGLSARSVARGT